ncbi:MAG: tRNA lysidine(34) synthetase TilS [Bacillota bacterium]|nr:tRNA lysidine(34) synthetase TilS [Bacillota bacterium]
MNRKVLETIKRFDMLKNGKRVLCAVSGGADSMAMLVCLSELSEALGITVAAAHLNHMLRGAESDRDEAFVRDYCRDNGIPFYCERIDVNKESKRLGKGTEDAARSARYLFLERAREALSCDLIATAHTSNDNLETMLLNLSRGTGILGLCGIPPVRDRIIRPIIDVKRIETEEYLTGKGVGFVTDSTNLENKYARNKIRNNVLPQLVSAQPAVIDSARKASDILRQDADFIMTEVRKLAEKAKTEENAVSFSAREFALAHPAVSGRALRLLYERLTGSAGELSAAHAAAVLKLCAGKHPSKKISLPGFICAERRNEELILSKGEPEFAGIPEIQLLSYGKYDINGTNYFLEYKKAEETQKIYNLSQTFFIDCGKINGCLIVRSRKEGDAIKLPGRGTKTLKKLFIEEKIPLKMRALIPVVADSTRVVAVCGFGADQFFESQNIKNAAYLNFGSANNKNEG